MWTREFWKATAERVIRAFALAFLAAFGGGTVADVRAIDWRAALLVASITAGLNLLVSLAAGAGIGPRGSPSLVRDPAAAGPVHDPVEPEPEPTNVHRVADRADLAERLHERPSPSGAPISKSSSYTGLSLSSRAEDGPLPDPPDYPDPGVTGRGYQPGEHRRDPDLPPPR